MIKMIKFSKEEQLIVKDMAEKAWLGSSDAKHATRGTRQHDPSQWLLDQETAQYGELALHKFVFGEEGRGRYILQREERNKNKYKGDDGSDLYLPEAPDIKVDSKASTMRRSQDPLSYNLIVRPRDFHEESMYVLVLRPKTNEPVINIIGCATTNMLPNTTADHGVFKGAYVLSATRLTPPDTLLEYVSEVLNSLP